MTLWDLIKKIFGYEDQEPEKTPVAVPDVPSPPAVIPVPLPTADIDWINWASKAAYISSTFEGKGGDYANPTGNFDGAYLTVGLLGLTWKYSNQQPLIKWFVDKYGLPELLKHMPQSGKQYYEAAKLTEASGGAVVAKWSNGSATVKEPYRSELRSFWPSDIMRRKQDETYASMMGVFAKKKALEAQAFFKLPLPLFEHYAFFWDQAVLNGTGNTIPFEDYTKVSIQTVLNFVKNPVGFNADSNRQNYKIWSDHINSGRADESELIMFRLAYLRAMKSRSEPGEDFRGTTLMRRATLALGIGVVNGSERTYEWEKPGSHAVDVTPPASVSTRDDVLIAMARGLGMGDQMVYMLEVGKKKGLAQGANYWALLDFRKRSSENRLFIFDVKNKTYKSYLAAHGIGSEGPTDDGYANVFGNVPNSNMSSLGVYQCAEPYQGKHGLSMRLDGLESTNSNARARAIVIHTADYVSKDYIKQYGRIGRSNGCPAVPKADGPTVVANLQKGSLLYAFK